MRQTTIAVAAVLVAAATGCGHSSASPAAVLRAYIRAVEPIRLGVNKLLDTADPVLDAYRERRRIVENTASADLEPNHVIANDVDTQLLAVQSGEHTPLSGAHGIDPLETYITIGVDHRPTLPHRQAGTGRLPDPSGAGRTSGR